MRFSRIQSALWAFLAVLTLGFTLAAIQKTVSAQETTGGLQGSVKDPSGAVIPGATITATAPSLIGAKTVVTDSAGYYRFANLPPGTYTISVKAQGFDSLKRAGLIIQAGHLPSVDLTMKLGSVSTVVSVNALEAPQIDVTTTTTTTTIPQDVIQNIPHGTSFQSVIQFAPGSREEPLMGNTSTQGNGGTSPGNGGNGNAFGFSVGGAADNENAYLVEGQETAEIVGGYSHTNVPFDFIQETEMKTSGVEAQYGGSLGGVVNVIMKKGTANWHGSVFTQFENDAMDGSPVAYSRYDPAGVTLAPAANGTPNDPNFQLYQPKKDKTGDVFPGVTLGGPLVGLFPKVISDHISQSIKDKMYAFLAFNPQWLTDERTVDYTGTPYATGNGIIPFSQNTHTYYGNARVDAAITDKIRVFGSWLYQGQRRTGEFLPYADSTTGLTNLSTSNDPAQYAHSYLYTAPNITTNVGADITLTQSLVSTTRFGYFFENYHDDGIPFPADVWQFEASGIGQSALCPTGVSPCPTWPSLLNETQGYSTGTLAALTDRNSNKHIQFDQDFSWYKSGWAGTHNFKFGYQLNRESNYIYQGNNSPDILVYPGQPYTVLTTGLSACQAEVAAYGASYGKYDSTTGDLIGCSGTYGYLDVRDIGTGGKAISYNNALFAQDAWTMKKGVTVSAGLRVEKEYLPAESTLGGANPRPINFGWGDKIEPRVGAAWDIFQNGKAKLFGEYGVFNDIMKLNLAISSFGGQYWQDCVYLLDNPDYTGVAPSFDSAGRYCSGTGQATYTGSTPNSTSYPFVENVNYRSNEGAAPGIKPYRQHETAFGFDYQINPSTAFEARWDRRRLDHAIEDAAIYNPYAGGENFEIVNPGEGPDATWNDYWKFIYGTDGGCAACGPNPKAARSYDGIELRLNKNLGHDWSGMFSYVYSNLRGNYSGLTDTDLSDGGGGRISPNNSRAFDEPYFYYTAHGTSSNGPLPTDRPNTFSGYAAYTLPWDRLHLGNRNSTDFGIFQVAYQGAPLSSYIDVGSTYGAQAAGAYFVYPEGRGMWTDVSQDPTSGVITIGNTYARRTPWYTQTDFNFKHTYKIKESQSIVFDATIGNILNQRAITEYNSVIDSNNYGDFIAPSGANLATKAATADAQGPTEGLAYAALEHPYNWKSLVLNSAPNLTINSQYGKPLNYQASRTIRLQLHYNF